MIADYHTHTHFSTDSEALPREHIEKAISLGMSEICFTDHMDYDFPLDEEGKVQFIFDVDKYFEELLALKEEYRSQLKVKIGIEVGLNPENDVKARELVNSYDFDFVIGSSHVIDGQDPYYPSFWEGKNIHECIFKYYDSILRNVTLYQDYDVYGHLDYIRRYVPDKNYVYKDTDFDDITDMIMKNIIANGKGIELNTTGLAKGLTTFVPTISLLKRYRDLGGEIITIGSDAHDSKKVGFAFKTARDILINTGYRYVTTYENRIASFIHL